MKIALTEDIRNIDSIAIEESFVPSIVLMENAGLAVFSEAKKELEDNVIGKKIVIFAGKGNNGGDAFVVARHFINEGAIVRVFLLASPEDLSSDTRVNFDILENMQAEIHVVNDDKKWDKISVHLAFCDLIIDGILGTGFYGLVTGHILKAIELINNSKKNVLAIDIPSGVNGNNGKVEENRAVLAKKTVTFALPKMGLYLLPGRIYTGNVVVKPIGIPKNIIEDSLIQQFLLSRDFVKELLPIRDVNSHKNMFKAGVIAGSKGMHGAAVLCSEAALKTGSGIVRLYSQESIYDVLSSKLTEVMLSSLPSDEKNGISEDYTDFEVFNQYNALAVGPGLGIKEGTKFFIENLLCETTAKLVLDADALNIISDNPEILQKTKETAVITPHLGEMARLTGLTVSELIEEGLLGVVRRYAIKWRVILVLKGVPSFIGLPNGKVYLNNIGNSGMSTAGSGDVLTGIISSFIAQGMSQENAAIAGVFLHAYAGDMIAKNTPIGFTASDIISMIAKARKNILED